MGRASGTDPLKGRIVAAWAVFALILGAVLAAVQLASQAEIRFFGLPGSGPSSTAGLMILAGSGCVAWGFSVHLRCSDIKIRGNLKIIAALLAAWLLDVLLKYPVKSDLAASVMWYLYYVPMMFIPTFFLASALHAAALDRHVAWQRVVSIAWVIDAVFCVLVLTNNYHHLVFAFDLSDPHWSRDYTYQAGYWCVTAWALVQYVGFFAAAFPAARTQLKSAFLPMAIILGVGAAYFALFIARKAGLFSTNIALVYSILVIVALELSLDLGILPSYARYDQFFSKLPFDLKILSRERDVVYQTTAATEIPDAVRTTLGEIETPRYGIVSFRTSAVPSTLFKVYSVVGGDALLSEDMTALDERRRLLSEHQAKLRRANAMLKRDRELAMTLHRQEDARALFAEIERALESKTQRISELLDDLPQGSDPVSAAARRERLELVFNETAADLRSLDIECAALVETSGVLPAATVSVLYDCLYDFAAAAFSARNPVLMLFVRDGQSGEVEMRAALESDGAVGSRFQESLDELRKSLISQHAAFTLETSRDSASLSVSLEGR